MSKKSRITVIITAAVLAILAARGMIAFKRFSKVERDFQSIQRGESRAAVSARFGKPNYYAGKCGSMGVVDKACTMEYVYSHPLAPILPDYYVVSFSSDDRVIDAEHWQSP